MPPTPGLREEALATCRLYLESQRTQNQRPAYPKVAQNSSKQAQDYGPLAFEADLEVIWNGLGGAVTGCCVCIPFSPEQLLVAWSETSSVAAVMYHVPQVYHKIDIGHGIYESRIRYVYIYIYMYVCTREYTHM